VKRKAKKLQLSVSQAFAYKRNFNQTVMFKKTSFPLFN
jgi:hypothetical protein